MFLHKTFSTLIKRSKLWTVRRAGVKIEHSVCIKIKTMSSTCGAHLHFYGVYGLIIITRVWSYYQPINKLWQCNPMSSGQWNIMIYNEPPSYKHSLEGLLFHCRTPHTVMCWEVGGLFPLTHLSPVARSLSNVNMGNQCNDPKKHPSFQQLFICCIDIFFFFQMTSVLPPIIIATD